MIYKKIYSLLLLCVCIFGFTQTSFAQKKRVPTRKREIIQAVEAPKYTPELKRRVETFNSVWLIIKENYFDQTFSGLDWNKIKLEYEPRILRTTSDNQMYDILQEMIGRLNRSHFAIIPPEVYQAIEKAKSEAKAKEKALAAKNAEMDDEDESEEEESDSDFDAYGTKYGIGVDLRLIDEKFVITRIDKNSTAEKAGLKIGYVIDKVNDVSLAALLQKIEIYYSKNKNFKRYLPAEIGDYLLNGEKDTIVALTCLNENEQPIEFKVPRTKINGETISIGKNFPEQFLKFETASLNEDVGLIRFNIFAVPVIEKFCAALTEFKDKKALVIDLRGNTGGILGSMVGLSGMLTEKSIDLGTSIYKVGTENLTALSKAKNFKGKVVFLVDNQTVSAAEIFSAALQENNRAVIVGEKTAGEALPAISVALQTGAVLYYPIANFKTHNGNYLEGKGVEPDFAVSLDRKTLLTGTDAQMSAALKIIREDKVFRKADQSAMTIKGAGNSPPPPPPPAAKLKQLGSVTIKAVPPPPAAPKPPENNVKDEKAIRAIDDFAAAVGGQEAFGKINSYTLKGSTTLTIRGTSSDMEIQVFRQKPDKYSEFWNSSASGEIRQIYNGKQTSVQSEYGITREIPGDTDTAKVEIFAPLNDLMKKDYFKSLKYQGIFDRNDRKVHLIEGVTKENYTVALAFDVETKMLIGYVLQYYGISFGDYRKVENVMLPFSIEREGFMDIKLDEIKINSPIEESNFSKKLNCFDVAN